MRIIQTVEFTDEDKELLKQLLPKDPCNGCSNTLGCCGCPEGYNYAEKYALTKMRTYMILLSPFVGFTISNRT